MYGLTGFDLCKQEKMLLFVCTETIESKPVQLEIICMVILPPVVSVLWIMDRMKESGKARSQTTLSAVDSVIDQYCCKFSNFPQFDDRWIPQNTAFSVTCNQWLNGKGIERER